MADKQLKLSGEAKRTLFLVNVFNFLIGIYLILVAIISLVNLRWYHMLTVRTSAKHFITAPTSYFAFVILLFVGCVLILIFILNIFKFGPKEYNTVDNLAQDALTNAHRLQIATSATTTILHKNPSKNTDHLESGEQDSYNTQLDRSASPSPPSQLATTQAQVSEIPTQRIQTEEQQLGDNVATSDKTYQPISHAAKFRRQKTNSNINTVHALNFNNNLDNNSHHVIHNNNFYSHNRQSNGDNGCTYFASVGLYFVANIGFVIILIVWLLNTGEFVRESIMNQLNIAFDKYQFSNRMSYISVAIDSMQSVNDCCGNMEYSDFPHSRISGLSPGHYPGSCCRKIPYGTDNRAVCNADEVSRAKQTSGCLQILSNYYDTISILVVPIALAGLFVNIIIVALLTMNKVRRKHYLSATPSIDTDHHLRLKNISRLASRNHHNNESMDSWLN